ncbi:MAG: hypothetical protein K9G62_04930 [Alphaproteobacteria bacterium]|nr:hypothetical protein [Alphaproteobacteria bacterium]
MAGSISGIGGYQVGASSQQSGAQTVKPQDEQQQPKQNKVQPQRAAAAGTQKSNAGQQDFQGQMAKILNPGLLESNTVPERGSVVDISV